MRGNKKLVFENGREFRGRGFGADADAVFEVTPCTYMTGYQEAVSNPAYSKKFLLFTYPLIGNCGLTQEDYESKSLTVGGIIVREYNNSPSNYRYVKTLADDMEECGIPGICGADTREMARMLRTEGTMRAALTGCDRPAEEVLEYIAETAPEENLTAGVSCKKPWYSRTSNRSCNVVAVDCGVTNSLVAGLNARGCNVVVTPYNTPVSRIMEFRPDGIIVAGGPEDIPALALVSKTVKELAGRLPVLGVGSGHLAVAMAGGAKIYRMKNGHHGGNYPVRRTAGGKTEISAQSHSYAVDESSLAGTELAVTHRNITDKTVEGVECVRLGLLSVQYQPSGVADSSDGAYILDDFALKARQFAQRGDGGNA